MKEQWVKVKPDIIYRAIFYVTSVLIIGASLWAGMADTQLFWIALVAWLMVGLLYSTIFQAAYCFRSELLELRLGIMRERIFYDQIKSIRKIKSWASSMAVTYEKIEIRQHGKGYILGTTYCSANDIDQFIQELRSHCRHLEG